MTSNLYAGNVHFDLNNFAILFSSLFTASIVDIFKLNITYSALISGLLVQIIYFFGRLEWNYQLHMYDFNYIVGGLLLLLMVYLIIKLVYIYRHYDANYVTINICTDRQIKKFVSYVEFNGIYYDNACVNTNIGDINKMQQAL
jgi:hypothetical protein